ncbi:MAG TPA: hypothetical protein VEY31_05635 [Roseococcus sp.]|nr:hypothetical protein [Roseococcus sp.]
MAGKDDSSFARGDGVARLQRRPVQAVPRRRMIQNEKQGPSFLLRMRLAFRWSITSCRRRVMREDVRRERIVVRCVHRQRYLNL